MNCQQCPKPATVHLTDLVSDHAGQKYPVEIHLCLAHAVAAGYVPEPPAPTALLAPPAQPNPAKTTINPTQAPTSIVPAPHAPTGLTVSRKPAAPAAPETLICPHCGNTWTNFKQHGLIGCPHDYEVFAPKLLALIQRAQENASQHLGKLPRHHAHTDHARQIALTRLRRELQAALDAEHYELAAQLRDELKALAPPTP